MNKQTINLQTLLDELTHSPETSEMRALSITEDRLSQLKEIILEGAKIWYQSDKDKSGLDMVIQVLRIHGERMGKSQQALLSEVLFLTLYTPRLQQELMEKITREFRIPKIILDNYPGGAIGIQMDIFNEILNAVEHPDKTLRDIRRIKEPSGGVLLKAEARPDTIIGEGGDA